MASGGVMNLGSAGLQFVGGLAQSFGGDTATGSHNMKYGGLNLAASLSFSGLAKAVMPKGKSVANRVFKSDMQAGMTAGGFVSDFISSESPLAAPKESDCMGQ